MIAAVVLAVAAIAAAVAGWVMYGRVVSGRADDRVARADAERERDGEAARRALLEREAEEYRESATSTVNALRSQIRTLEADLARCSTPDARRARWERMLQASEDAHHAVTRDPVADARAKFLRGVGGREPTAGAAGGGPGGSSVHLAAPPF